MPRLSLFRVVNLVLLAGVIASFATPGTAQEAPTTGGTTTSGTRELVTTTCRMGQVTVCGTEPAQTHCTFTFSINFGRIGPQIGVTFGGYTCTTMGSVNLYKDLYKDTTIQSCSVIKPDGTVDESGGTC